MEKRIVIYAPAGKDARLASRVLEEAGLECSICKNLTEIVDALGNGIGALFIVEEVLTSEVLKPLVQFLAAQPPWSDLPILVLSSQGGGSPGLQHIVEKLGNVTLLERPVRTVTLLSAVRAALRARTRQYDMRETDRLKDEFLASLGHELRNPLAPIRTAMQVLNNMFPSPSNVHDVTQVVERQVGHLTRLVDDLLDVARITNGKVALRKEHVTVSEIMTHAIEICSQLIEDGNHRIDVTQPMEEIWLDGDRARLVQSLANVLANAVKFTPDPSTIFFKAQVERANIVFRIKDAGIGLEPGAPSKIFGMFTQSDAARGQFLGGLGIGLGLAKRFTEMHGGTIHATSEGLGHGSEFVLCLPIVIQPTCAAIKPRAMPKGMQPDAENFRILVVDDNQDGANMLQIMLELDGYSVYKAYDGRQAIEAAQQLQPHAILMDIGLPDMKGYEAARHIRQQPGGKDMVVIALTGWGHDDVKRCAAEAGMDYHLVKPVDLNVLRHHLANIAQSRQAPC